ncbi:thiamine ABC transporter substrate-binding protein [Natronorubrum sp. JWXQ-INN-674]|uniref:Thiamine ABC transporter substrate-binding protein n=1 Tax=Natronorubrum halalkaliphilum TaxID=2691917 RepID=A0A6B0VKQ2_9EURY|nr:thiamine ABC transporter substrate-binding protein [Natronorubrum halalkaliphilum]MXV61586.1 thiamine ABC transporter substrate-binding protein [Natronorubrum halalkaliphilum]
MKRRTVVRAIGGASGGALAGLAGCTTRNGDDEPPDGPDDEDTEPEDPDHDGTLRIATYRSMVTGTNPAGPWLAEAFEETYPDAEIEWVLPESGVEHYVRRGEYDTEIDVDVLFGFTVGDLARIDDRVGAGGLLRELNLKRVEGAERIRDGLDLGDPHNRALTYDAGYVSLVYDERELDAPDTFAELLEDEYEDTLLAQHPGTSIPGQAFLLWLIETAGPDDALEYWEELAANGVRIHESWSDAYNDAYMGEERPMVVSYSADPVFAAAEEYDMERHRVAFPNDEGYAVPEGMGIFEGARAPDLAYAFLEFVLSTEAQIELARRNVQFPAIRDVELHPAFGEYRREPPEPVSISYTELRGSIGDWLGDWTDRFDEHLVEDGDGNGDGDGTENGNGDEDGN